MNKAQQQAFGMPEEKLITDIKTRWNSTFITLCSAVAAGDWFSSL